MDTALPQPQPVSAIDAITPAFSDTGRILFKPFRFGRWWRMGLLALATGEMGSGLSCNFNFPANFPKDSNPGQQQFVAGDVFSQIPQLSHIDPALIASLVTVLLVGIFALVVVHAYVSSVLRFVLFETVAEERFALIEGWKRRHRQGLHFFLFLITMGIISLAGFAVLAGIPMVLTAHSKSVGQGVPILAWLAAIPFLLLFFVLILLVYVFTKDFAVPVMALENVGVRPAMAKVWTMMKERPGSYAGYAGMKLLLAIAAAIGFSIVQFIVMLIILLPLVLVAVAVGISSPGFYKDPATLAAIITLGVLLLFVIFYVLAVIGSPITVFFQSYAFEFFGSRYVPLWQVMHPAPPPPPPAPPPLPSAPTGSMPAM